jgi:hypothetical protein
MHEWNMAPDYRYKRLHRRLAVCAKYADDANSNAFDHEHPSTKSSANDSAVTCFWPATYTNK